MVCQFYDPTERVEGTGKAVEMDRDADLVAQVEAPAPEKRHQTQRDQTQNSHCTSVPLDLWLDTTEPLMPGRTILVATSEYEQQCSCVQEPRSARTDSKQYTLLTEIEKTTIHQGEKDTVINCSEQIEYQLPQYTSAAKDAQAIHTLKKECTTNTQERQAPDPRAPINSDMTQEMSNLRDIGEQQQTKDNTDCCGEQRSTSQSTFTDSLV